MGRGRKEVEVRRGWRVVARREGGVKERLTGMNGDGDCDWQQQQQ